MADFSNFKKYWLLLVVPILIFVLVLLFLNNGKPINSNAVIDAYKEIDKEQTQRIEKLEKVIEQHKNTLLMKIKEDSIMYMQSQIEIGKLNKNIKDIRKENEKMRNNINGADSDAYKEIEMTRKSIRRGRKRTAGKRRGLFEGQTARVVLVQSSQTIWVSNQIKRQIV